MQSKKEFLTAKEAAAFLGVKIRTIREITSKRKIRFYKPGGRIVLFRKADLIEYIESATIESGKALNATTEQKLINNLIR